MEHYHNILFLVSYNIALLLSNTLVISGLHKQLHLVKAFEVCLTDLWLRIVVILCHLIDVQYSLNSGYMAQEEQQYYNGKQPSCYAAEG